MRVLHVASNDNRGQPSAWRFTQPRFSARPLVGLVCCALLACSKNGPSTAAPAAQTSTPTRSAGTNAAVAVNGAGTPALGGSAGTTLPISSAAGNTSAIAASAGNTSGSGGAAAHGSGNSGNSGGTAAGTLAPPPAAGASGGSAGASAGTGGATNVGNDATDLWISTTGADTNPGSQAMPLHNLTAAVSRAKPGMTIWVAPGIYPTSQTVALKANGTEQSPIRISATSGDRPVFNFMAQTRGDSSARGLELSGDYWHITGIEVENAGDNCIHIAGSHNTIEQVVIHGCDDTGLQITANSSDTGDKTRAANNIILNSDSYENFDAQNQGENADGFAAKLYIGPGNVFRGCRSWNNADDGWDLFASDDVVTFENCWALANGKIGAGQNNTNGDGNGFKLGGAPRAGDPNMGGAVHILKGCLAIENAACGFVRNNNPDVPELAMCGGQGDGKGLLCSLTINGQVNVTSTAAQAIAAKRDAAGNLPPLQ